MKLEEGMYVRTKDGLIRKCVTVDLEDTDAYELDDYIYVKYGDEINWLDEAELEKYISKSSYNIIDLIEEGDYVNGYKIDYINSKCETPFLRSNQPYRVDNTLYSTLAEKGKDYNQPLHFYNEDIKSIVTKEQFESMKYEVKE